MNILGKRGMSVADLAERTGYNPLFFENIITGKSRQIPVDFFLRVAQVLDLSEEEKDALVRSWAFGRA
jgi:transcriptional regulator with XRE-family HTH domain